MFIKSFSSLHVLIDFYVVVVGGDFSICCAVAEVVVHEIAAAVAWYFKRLRLLCCSCFAFVDVGVLQEVCFCCCAKKVVVISSTIKSTHIQGKSL